MRLLNLNGGILNSLRGASATVISILKNRAELAFLEIKEEKESLVSAAVWGGVFIFSSLMAVIAISCTILLLFWEQKLSVAISLLVFYLVGGVISFLLLKRRLKTPMPFAETMAHFKKDRAWLQDWK